MLRVDGFRMSNIQRVMIADLKVRIKDHRKRIMNGHPWMDEETKSSLVHVEAIVTLLEETLEVLLR